VLGLAGDPVYLRLLRADMIQNLQQDFVLVARRPRVMSNRWVLLRHVLRPSTLTLLTVFGLNIAQLVNGAIVVEFIFDFDGMGSFLIDAVASREFFPVQTIVAWSPCCSSWPTPSSICCTPSSIPRVRSGGDPVTTTSHGGSVPSRSRSTCGGGDGTDPGRRRRPPPLAPRRPHPRPLELGVPARGRMAGARWWSGSSATHGCPSSRIRTSSPRRTIDARDPPGTTGSARRSSVRDVFAQVLDRRPHLAARRVIGTAVGILLGGALGLLAGYLRGWVDTLVSGLIAVTLSVPALVLVIFIVAFGAAVLFNVILAVSLLAVPALARIVRASTLQVAQRDFVKAAR
jgi:ABC-type dipeptide/oligopeptide/nickel transport system permease component